MELYKNEEVRKFQQQIESIKNRAKKSSSYSEEIYSRYFWIRHSIKNEKETTDPRWYNRYRNGTTTLRAELELLFNDLQQYSHPLIGYLIQEALAKNTDSQAREKFINNAINSKLFIEYLPSTIELIDDEIFNSLKRKNNITVAISSWFLKIKRLAKRIYSYCRTS